MTPNRSLLNLFITALFIITLTGCNLNEDPPEVAEGHVEFQLIDEATDEPIVGALVQLASSYEGEETLIDRGVAQTNTEGRIQGIMTANSEVTIDLFYLAIQLEDESLFEIELDANLPLRFEEPFESEEYVVPLDTTATDEEDEDGSDEEEEGDEA